MREPSAKTLTSRLLASTALATALALTTPAVAGQVLPTGGSVASGSATIGASGSAMTIQQTTPNAVINWNSFSVGAPNSVTFAQPNASSATLNRVTGSTPSSIAGQINANGQVYLVNPNGIAITKSGTVNVGGGFVASTLAITNDDFNNGKLKFTGSGASAAVSNDGTITTGPGGIVGLIGGSVSNSGTITAPLGKVALGSGEQATLDLTGDGFLQVALPTGATTADGKALVDVSGKVHAAGGQIAIKAATAANAVRNAINLSGIASARSARKVGGSIILGGSDGGDVTVGGALDASGRKGGGSVAVTGHKVALRNASLTARSASGAGGAVAVSGTGAVKLVHARLDVSGATGGGTIAVGGNARGLGPLVNAASTTITRSALRADALTSGNGGAIAVWSNGATTVTGALTARGGAVSGAGGTVETSGQTAQVQGAHVDTTAAHGATGSWLIDPDDFTIAASGGDITGAGLSGELATTSITIHSTDNGHAGGEILVNDNVSWSSGSTLTLDAASNVVVGAAVTISGAGKLAVITADTTLGGTAGVGELQFALSDTASLGSVSFTNPALNPSLTINGAGYTLVSTEAALAAIAGGGNYALTTDIALTGAYTNSVIAGFTGNLQGLGHTLQNLKITSNGEASVGLIGVLDTIDGGFGTVANLFLQNVNVNGGATSGVGALVGENFGRVSNSGASGTVTGTGSNIGGLVGNNFGLVENSQSSVVVNGSITAGTGIGGLVGANSGVVNASYATGAVTGDDSVGGLVGSNTGYVNGGSAGFVVGNTAVGGVVGSNAPTEGDTFFDGKDYGPTGTVTGAYGFGGVFGTTTAGGVVGLNTGAVSYSYFNGPVSGDTSIGGVVGENDGSVSISYAINAVSGTTNVGGLVGLNGGSIDSSFALGAVRGTTFVGGLVGLEGTGAAPTSVSNSYSTGAVSGTTGVVGGLIGAVHGLDDSITNAYWDTQTSGQPASAGGAGAVPETTGDLQGGVALTFSIGETPSNFTGGAAGGVTGIYPYLTSLFPDGVHAISGFAFTGAGGPLASGANGAVTVYGDFGIPGGGSSVRNPGTTGANGYYYILATAAVLPAGANVLVYTNASTAVPSTGATNAATYVAATGANNQTGVDIFANTLTETTALPTYSALVAAVANATAGDTTTPGAADAIAGVSIININSTVANFTVDTAITTTADLTITGTQTTLAANVTATGGVNFDTPVVLASTVTVDSGTAGTFFASTINGSATAGAGLTVNGPVILSGDVTTSNGALAFNGPVTLNSSLTINSGTAATTFGSTIDSSTDGGTLFDSLTGVAGAFSFGGAIGGQFALGAVSFTSPASMTLPAITAQTIFAHSTGGDIILGGVLTASGSGTAVTLAADGAFVNNVGPGAIVLTGDPPNWLIYSNNPTADVFNGLNSNNYPIWNTPYPAAAPPTSGNFYLFAFQPTVTFTSTNDAKTYGQDVTARVANDFTFSGVEPTVSGAYLGGAAGAYSGAPSVTSAGSPAAANVVGGPYAITVAQGSLAALNGYALAFASPGLLSVGAEAITVTAAANTKVYDSTTSAAATPTVTTGTLYDAATLSETYATPNAGTGITLTPKIAFSAPAAAGNYTVTLAPAAVGTITPEPITVTAAANTKTYDSTTSAAATPTVTTGTLYDAATLAETYATPNAGTGITLTPTIAFATPAAAGNYAVTLAPAAVGTINPEPITITAGANTKVYDTTTTAAATPTVTTGTLYDAATLSETYATPNAGTGLTLNPHIAFTTPAAAGNYTVTLAAAAVGTITPEPITITAAANTKIFDSTTSAAATPTATTGTLYNSATLSETYATPFVGTGLTLTPKIAFAAPAAASNYAVTLAAAAVGTITPEPITITAAANTKTYDGTTSAAATPTVTTGVLYYPATLSETYATPNAGTGLTLTPYVGFSSRGLLGLGSNFVITLVSTQTGTIAPEPITVTATPNTKIFDGTTSAAALPLLTAGTLFDPATLSESYATPGPGNAINLIPAIAFNSATTAGDYAVTLVPTGTTPPSTGVIVPPGTTQINLSPSVFVDRNPLIGIPGGASTCGPDVQLPDPSSFADPVAAVQAISAATSQYVERCKDASQEDIANALERYADALQVIIEKLPPKLRVQLQHIPALVRAAAVRARAAPTRAAAVRVLRQTVAMVHHEIMLVRADDPDSARVRNAVSTGVSGVLNSAAVALARSEGI